jgi:hypothetical protein
MSLRNFSWRKNFIYCISLKDRLHRLFFARFYLFWSRKCIIWTLPLIANVILGNLGVCLGALSICRSLWDRMHEKCYRKLARALSLPLPCP